MPAKARRYLFTHLAPHELRAGILRRAALSFVDLRPALFRCLLGQAPQTGRTVGHGEGLEEFLVRRRKPIVQVVRGCP